MNYCQNGSVVNTKELSDSTHVHAHTDHLANAFHGFYCKFCSPIIIPAFQSAFFSAVRHVIQLCAKKKVGRVNARRIVAPVTNTSTIRNDTILKNPGKPMCANNLSVYFKSSIPLFISESCPYPAAFGLLHIFPKSFFYWTQWLSILRLQIAFPATVIISSNFGRLSVEFIAALSTFKKHLKTFLSDVNGTSSYCCWSSPTILQ